MGADSSSGDSGAWVSGVTLGGVVMAGEVASVGSGSGRRAGARPPLRSLVDLLSMPRSLATWPETSVSWERYLHRGVVRETSAASLASMVWSVKLREA